MKLSCRDEGDAFEMTRGTYAAVVLAGYGLPVAPFDLEASRILAKPSNDIDTVLALFCRDKGAFVGYSVCDAPFYLLLTDCVQTLRQRVPVRPELSEVRKLFARVASPTVGLLDPDPMAGSIMLYAGWQIDGQPDGAPNDGYLPVPRQLLRAVVNDPTVAYSFWHP
jgi:hypothetical protein